MFGVAKDEWNTLINDIHEEKAEIFSKMDLDDLKTILEKHKTRFVENYEEGKPDNEKRLIARAFCHVIFEIIDSREKNGTYNVNIKRPY